MIMPLNCCHLEILLVRLQDVEWVAVGKNTRTQEPGRANAQPLPTSPFPHTNASIPPKHHNNCAHDAVVERVTATKHVVELGLPHAVIHVDGGDEQLTFGNTLFQLEDTCGLFLFDTLGSHSRPIGTSSDMEAFTNCKTRLSSGFLMPWSRPWRTQPPARCPCACCKRVPSRRRQKAGRIRPPLVRQASAWCHHQYTGSVSPFT